MAVRQRNISSASTPPGPVRDVRTSRRFTRLNVAISVVAAIALVIVANFISGSSFFRKDMQTLGRYRLSQTAQRILEGVNLPVNVTVIYTASSQNRKAETYRPQLMDLLAEMQQCKKDLVVSDVDNNDKKARIVERLRVDLDGQLKEHVQLVQDFLSLSQSQVEQYRQIASQWDELSRSNWLNQFAGAGVMQQRFGRMAGDLKELESGISQQLANTSSLPNYTNLTLTIRQQLQDIQRPLQGLASDLHALAQVPQAVRQAQPELVNAVRTVSASVHDVQNALAKSKEQQAAPTETLAMLSRNLRKLADNAQAVSAALSQLRDGPAFPISRTQGWTIRIELNDPAQVELPDAYASLASAARDLADRSDGLLASGSQLSQKQALDAAASSLHDFRITADSIAEQLTRLLDSLVKPDAGADEVLQKCRDNKYLSEPIQAIESIIKRVGALPRIAMWDKVIDRLGQDNVVLLEVGDRKAVVGFEEVWPQARTMQIGQPDKEGPARIFNGDMAVSSRILSLSHEPLADVVVAFFEKQHPSQPANTPPFVRGPISSRDLGLLFDRMEAANLQVVPWNLAQGDGEGNPGPLPPPRPTPGRKQILLVLPPPSPELSANPRMPIPQFGTEHITAIGKAIEQGMPAVFLVGGFSSSSIKPSRLLVDYLSSAWGIQAKTTYTVVHGQRDINQPDTFHKIDPFSQPLSDFSDNPIGKPLKSLRFSWLSPCPIKGIDPGVTYESILQVPADRQNVWAVADWPTFYRKVVGERKNVTPDAKNDVIPPFDLAISARKDGRQIVVLGVGPSFLTNWLASSARDEADNTVTPRMGDADLLINTVYYLGGQDQYIGAGPSEIEPIHVESPMTAKAIQWTVGLAYPVAILLCGAVVLLIRRVEN